MKTILTQKKILVTGACGTVGSELVKQLLTEVKYQPAELIALDNNESELFFLEQKYKDDKRLNCFLADIRDKQTLTRLMKDIDIVFHLAALKHVILCERSPMEATQTNILGVENIVSAAVENQVEKVIFTSSDKAVNPTNVMGTSKLMGERLMSAANSHMREATTLFSSTRFGNVMGSRGSVIPIFHRQLMNGGPITLTHPQMTRFIMSIKESVRLVIDSADIAKGGEVFVTKMPVIYIKDLAEVMIDELAGQYGYAPKDIRITEIGTKAGEKLYEELISDEEMRRTVELDDYFAILPAFENLYREIDYNYSTLIRHEVDKPYNSSVTTALTKPQLKKFLRENGLLDEFKNVDQHPSNRYWPGKNNETLAL